ncbi:MAG TPA: patatin-like phospholipase family protein [Puia sp.]|nr:patatin-like phospholipase family protein [Puia sp.]
MSKRALVISGGGSKGAFAVGVIKQLATQFPAIGFDIFIGTSTGSLIAPLAATGEIDVLEQFYTGVKTSDIIIKGNVVTRILSDNALFDAGPLASLISRTYDDKRSNTIFGLPKELFLVTTCLQTGQPVYFATKDHPIVSDFEIEKLNTPDELRRAIMASACQPVFMPPIEVHKGKLPMRQFVDGGVREYAGVQLAIDAGADEIYAILLTPGDDPPVEQTYNDAFTILERTIDIFTTDVAVNNIRIPLQYNLALRYIESAKEKMLAAGITQAAIDGFFQAPFDNPFAGKKPLKIYVIRPDAPLGGGEGGLDFDPVAMKGMIAKGETTISDFMASLPPEGSTAV